MAKQRQARPRLQRVLFFSYHYPPDQSAGALRTHALVHQLAVQSPDACITVFCSQPRRYGGSAHASGGLDLVKAQEQHPQIRIRRFWIPFFGQGPAASVGAYLIYMVQAVPAAVLWRPTIVIGTSAKLLTSFIAALSARLSGAKLYIDFRDTFADNFFYFYRWNKRILLQSLIMAIENVVLRCATSVNMVSIGFHEAFKGWERVLAKYSISLTNFSNGISRDFRARITQAADASRPDPNLFRVVYAGNLGEGQDKLSLLISLAADHEAQRLMRSHGIRFEIYGSGGQVEAIQQLIANPSMLPSLSALDGLVVYGGLLPRAEVENVYRRADCLMLQLGLYSSLSMVIPTKVFEYAATPYPIVFGASGFTSTFISQISGSLPFEQCNAASFVEALVRAKQTSVDMNSRNRFLDRFDADAIYKDYAHHILSNKSKMQDIPASHSLHSSSSSGAGAPLGQTGVPSSAAVCPGLKQ